MLDFFNKYFHPSSTQRARLSVHLHAQGKAEGVEKRQEEAIKKAHETSEEEKQKLKEEYAKYFGKDSDVNTTMKGLLEGLGSKDPVPAIWQSVESLGSHLREALRVSEKTISMLLEQAKTLGVEQTKPEHLLAVNGTTAADLATEITDVRVFKSSLVASSGPRAAKDLSEYEDTDAKL